MYPYVSVQLSIRAIHQVQRAPYHPLNVSILSVLQKEGLIRGFVVEGNRLNILLKHYMGTSISILPLYPQPLLGAPVIRNVRVVSRPSREIWVSPNELKVHTRHNSGVWIVRTPAGVVTHREAIEMGIGCQVLFAVNNGCQQWC
jgi:ribosomal protein S8